MILSLAGAVTSMMKGELMVLEGFLREAGVSDTQMEELYWLSQRRGV